MLNYANYPSRMVWSRGDSRILLFPNNNSFQICTVAILNTKLTVIPIPPQQTFESMIFLLLRWDMLAFRRVPFFHTWNPETNKPIPIIFPIQEATLLHGFILSLETAKCTSWIIMVIVVSPMLPLRFLELSCPTSEKGKSSSKVPW